MFGVSVEFYHVFSKFDPKIKVVWTEAGIHVLREPWHLCCHWDAPSFLVTWIFHHVLKDADLDEIWWTWKYDEIWWYRIWMFQNFRSEFWMSHFSPPKAFISFAIVALLFLVTQDTPLLEWSGVFNFRAYCRNLKQNVVNPVTKLLLDV